MKKKIKQPTKKELLSAVARLRGLCYHALILVRATNGTQEEIVENGLKMLKTKRYGMGFPFAK